MVVLTKTVLLNFVRSDWILEHLKVRHKKIFQESVMYKDKQKSMITPRLLA